MRLDINTLPKQITTPTEVHSILKGVLSKCSQADRDQEHLWVFLLDGRQRVKSLHLVSLGILNGALVHPREVYTRAIAERCAGIVLAHNHPSNVCEPSEQDLTTTKRMAEAGEILGIQLVDHIIVTDEQFYSFKAQGHLKAVFAMELGQSI